MTGLKGGKYLKQSTIYNERRGEVNLKKPFKETPDIYSANYLFISGLLVNKEQKLHFFFSTVESWAHLARERTPDQKEKISNWMLWALKLRAKSPQLVLPETSAAHQHKTVSPHVHDVHTSH